MTQPLWKLIMADYMLSMPKRWGPCHLHKRLWVIYRNAEIGQKVLNMWSEPRPGREVPL